MLVLENDPKDWNQETLILRVHTETGWSMEFRGGNEEQVRELFGTNILPCPFTSECETQVVVDVITKKNPKSRIFVAYHHD